MPPESDPHLRAAFAEFHRRLGAEAPPLEPMLLRARRAAEAEPPAARPRMALRVSFAAAAVCLALSGLWSLQLHHSADHNADASAQRVEQLLAAIEEQLDRNADFAPLEFPTDILLTQNQTDPSL